MSRVVGYRPKKGQQEGSSSHKCDMTGEVGNRDHKKTASKNTIRKSLRTPQQGGKNGRGQEKGQKTL